MMKQAKPYYDLKKSTKRICVLQGGTRSGKTRALAPGKTPSPNVTFFRGVAARAD